MKKIVSILTMVFATSVFAGPSFQIEYQDEKNTDTNKTSQAIAWTLKQKFTNTISGDVGGTTTQQDPNSSLSQRLEVGATYEPNSLYVRLAVGEKFGNTYRNAYYSVEPGVKFPIYGNLSGKLAYRYRNAFNDTTYSTQLENTYRAALSYSIDKQNSVGVGYDKTYGDSNKYVVKTNYTYSF